MWGFSELEFRTCLDCVDRWDELKAANPNFDFAPFMNGDLEEAIAYFSIFISGAILTAVLNLK
jgi:hypothetical protein